MISQEDFQANYYYILNQSKKSDYYTFNRTEPEEYFDDVYFGIEIFIPKLNEHLIFKEISFSYHFDLYKTENNRCEIVFKDFNHPSINIADYKMEPDTFELMEDLYVPQLIAKDSFEDFFAKTISPEIMKKIKTIDEQYFFEDKINKKMVVLDKNLLKDLQRNFIVSIHDFLVAVNTNDWGKVLNKNENLDKNEIEDLQDCIKLINTKFNYQKLNENLPNKEQEIKQKIKI